ncbi:MAG: hypothetical protein CFE31_06555 [Rhizobiales bacterium PAR1]|nr:MAG: hypothetical protein CFE31_06555 [Rhizobiales bacterium PAR1]
MIPVLLDGPTVEPISLAEAKLWLRLDTTDEDDLVRALIVAARLMVEAEIGQVLIGQNWRLVGDAWPAGELIPVRIGRIRSVSGGRVYSVDGVATAIAANRFTVFANSEPPAILALDRLIPGRAYAGIEIDIRLGFGEAASDVPETIRLAIRRLVTLWYENRGDTHDPQAGIPPQIRALLRPFRRIRL